jgi:hypothetical protein
MDGGNAVLSDVARDRTQGIQSLAKRRSGYTRHKASVRPVARRAPALATFVACRRALDAALDHPWLYSICASRLAGCRLESGNSDAANVREGGYQQMTSPKLLIAYFYETLLLLKRLFLITAIGNTAIIFNYSCRILNWAMANLPLVELRQKKR